ncbi:hypothetical protein KIN20_017043 [Parelaphostrongylus tenuis]|uniref:Uncharacterized protein n=1 Tax=Parelaphostrongylus tenuis TaxID=148309 RepID=A0AAD5N232_PARTN|nr:hypothetical protein KIN20_017043 [Parelaphostrongylus tenuis]
MSKQKGVNSIYKATSRVSEQVMLASQSSVGALSLHLRLAILVLWTMSLRSLSVQLLLPHIQRSAERQRKDIEQIQAN